MCRLALSRVCKSSFTHYVKVLRVNATVTNVSRQKSVWNTREEKFSSYFIRSQVHSYSASNKKKKKVTMSGEDRRMRYPYTMTAKLFHFPYAHYYKHAWVARYYVIGLVLTAPIMWKITKGVNNPENVAKWAEIRRKQFSGEDHH